MIKGHILTIGRLLLVLICKRKITKFFQKMAKDKNNNHQTLSPGCMQSALYKEVYTKTCALREHAL